MAVSVQWRSSRTKTTVRWLEASSRKVLISRSMRSRCGLGVSPCGGSRSPSDNSDGICRYQHGATRCSSGTSGAPPGDLSTRSSASRSGMYGSRGPCSGTHCPWNTDTPPSRTGGERRNSSTSVVLPMPASPVMKTSWRTPWRARRRCSWSWFNSVSRPTKRARCAPVDGDPRSIRGARGGDWSPRSALVAGACAQTLAMKRNPRRWAVSMKRGLHASSPRTRRSSPIDCVSVSSTTAASCQTSRWRSALVTRRPGRSTR